MSSKKNFFQNIYNKLSCESKKSYVRITFHFSSMTDEEGSDIHDALTRSITCPDVDAVGKTVSGVFEKDNLDINSIVALLQKKGFSILADKVDIEPHEERELNCLSIIIIIVGLWLIKKFLLK